VKDVLKKADIATNDDVKALQREIQSLKKELKAAKATKAPTSGKSGSGKMAAAVKRRSKTKAST
jgi:outer membrane protein TolC